MMYLKTPRYDTMFKLDTPDTSTALKFRYHKVVNLDQSRWGNEEIAAIFLFNSFWKSNYSEAVLFDECKNNVRGWPSARIHFHTGMKVKWRF